MLRAHPSRKGLVPIMLVAAVVLDPPRGERDHVPCVCPSDLQPHLDRGFQARLHTWVLCQVTAFFGGDVINQIRWGPGVLGSAGRSCNDGGGPECLAHWLGLSGHLLSTERGTIAPLLSPPSTGEPSLAAGRTEGVWNLGP